MAPDNPPERELNFRQLAETIPQLAWMAKADGWIFWYNRRWYEYTGTTPEQMEGWGWQSVHDPAELPRVMERWNNSIRTGEPFDLEFPLKGADGQFRWFLTRIAPLRDADGRIALWFGTNTDIHDHRRIAAEREELVRALQAQRANLAAIVEKAPAFIVTLTGPDHVIELANEQYYALINRRDIIGKTINEALPEIAGQGFIDLLDKVYRTGEPFIGNEVTVMLDSDVNSERHIVNFVYQALRNADGAISGIFVHGVDVTETVRARKAIESSERQRRLALDSAELGTWYIDFQAFSLTFDARFREIFGVHADHLTYEQAVAAIHAEDRDRLLAAFEAVMQPVEHPVPYAIEYRVVHPDGSIRWVFGKAKANFSGDKSAQVLVSLEGTVADITDRKQAETEQQLLAKQRQLALDAAHMGWWHYDPLTKIASFDQRYTEIFGITGHQRPNEEILKRLHPDDLPAVWAKVEAALNPLDPKPFSADYRIFHNDGSLRWVQAHGLAAFEGDGEHRRAVSFVGTVADITEDRAVQQTLRENEAKFRRLADTMPQIVWTAQPDGILNYYNHRWYEYVKLPDTAGEQAAWVHFVHPEDLNRVAAAWSASLSTGDPYSLEFRVRNGDGEYRWFLVRALPVRDESAAILNWFGTCTDINDRKHADAEREQLLTAERTARAQAENAGRIKDEFLATLSHEIRTPLNAILGWAQIMQQSPTPDDIAQGLEVIQRNARAQSQIVEDLLDMSRIISGKVRLDVQRLDLAAIVQSAVETARPTADAKGVRLKSVVDPLQGVQVSGDASRLQQVLWNLISNAIKFTPKNGQVQVLLERVNSHLEISVIDTGEGISQDFLPYVFDRFRQADASTTRRHGGLGLGLSIVKQLVELHGGSIAVKSAGPGHGATFVVTLPLIVTRTDHEPENERRHPRVTKQSTNMDHACTDIAGVRVLVIDDEPDARALVKRLLEDCNAIVTVTGSVDQALTLIQANNFDVLISDIGMPGEDGYSLIKRVRRLGKGRGRDIPAIALSAYARAEDRVKAISAGFFMHVAKPVEPLELITMVAGAAGRTGSSRHD